jgi:hypothetical protein
MLEALRKEVEALGKLHHDAEKNLTAGLPLPYGKNTLVEGPAARYEFWPSMAKEWPLLYICAQAILAAASNATTFNERMHSPAGTIYSKLRSSLRPSSMGHLTLALFYGRKWAKGPRRKWPGQRGIGREKNSGSCMCFVSSTQRAPRNAVPRTLLT